jgi:ubiquinone/menaquinone biosynthesis C-methylase UbiE
MNCWDQILPRREYSPEEPGEFVASSIKSLKRRQVSKALDLGCGAGRHLAYMARQGVQVCGIDLSLTGIDMARRKLKEQGLEALLVKCDMKALPFINSLFDAVICTRTVYHQALEEIRETIIEIHRVSTTKALVAIDFLSKRTYSYGSGVEVEHNTFIEQDGPEKGVLHHFTDEKELKELFEAFRTVNIKLQEREVKGKLRSRWIVTAMV